jgi:putative Holliday junction resolvase
MSRSTNKFTNALGLDVGMARIGVARINSIAQISEPLVVLNNDDNFVGHLQKLISEYSVDLIVVGLPRNMQGEKTEQTRYVEQFTENLSKHLSLRIIMQDETLSTVAASERVTDKTRFMEDAHAAAIILEDFIAVN